MNMKNINLLILFTVISIMIMGCGIREEKRTVTPQPVTVKEPVEIGGLDPYYIGNLTFRTNTDLDLYCWYKVYYNENVINEKIIETNGDVIVDGNMDNVTVKMKFIPYKKFKDVRKEGNWPEDWYEFNVTRDTTTIEEHYNASRKKLQDYKGLYERHYKNKNYFFITKKNECFISFHDKKFKKYKIEIFTDGVSKVKTLELKRNEDGFFKIPKKSRVKITALKFDKGLWFESLVKGNIASERYTFRV